MPLEVLDFGKIAGIFGLKVRILVGRFTISILSMKVLGRSKDVWKCLSCGFLMTCIVARARGSACGFGADDPAGMYLCSGTTCIPKVSAIGYNCGCTCSQRDM